MKGLNRLFECLYESGSAWVYTREPLYKSLGIQYIGVFNFRYTVYLCLKLGIKYSLVTKFGYKVYSGFLNFGTRVF